jgi:hypothetical protein
MKKSFLVFVGILIFGQISVAHGDSIRCGSRVVSTGDSRIDVLSKCGPPDDSEIVSYDTTYGGGRVRKSEKKVEKLYYNCGDGRFIQVLTIIDGEVVKIERGAYGSGPIKCE